MSKPTPLDKKVRQRLAYVFLLDEVGQPIKGAARRLQERALALQDKLDTLLADLTDFEVGGVQSWWNPAEINEAMRQAKTKSGKRLVKWD